MIPGNFWARQILWKTLSPGYTPGLFLLLRATFLGALDLFLELTVRAVPRTLTTNQVRSGSKQGTDGPELSHIHSKCWSKDAEPGIFIDGEPGALKSEGVQDEAARE
jgi:hypothetical protein